MEVKELLRSYAKGKRDFGFATLSGVDLTGAELPRIALYQATLDQATLVRVNFQRANLRQANLQGADLSQANLQQANLRRANLTGARLEGAILDGAILTGAILPDGTPYSSSPLEEEEEDDRPALTATDQSVPIAPDPSTNPVPRRLSTPDPAQSIWWWIPLLFLWVGFILFGLLLNLHQASGINWGLAWLSSIVWLLGESLTWFMPIIAAIAVFNAAGISVITLGTLGLVIPSLFVTFKVTMGWSIQESLKGSLWVGGLATILIQLSSWLFYGANAYNGGGIVIAFDTLHLAFLLVAAIGFTSLGSLAWRQLRSNGLTRLQTAGLVGIIAAIGLACGNTILA